MSKILILGGTKEAAELATLLITENHNVITSLAGRTKEPKPMNGEVRIGGFGGTEGLANYLTENNIDLLIDATHPFAKQISKNAVEAAKITKVKLEIHTRPKWEKQEGDNWLEVASLEEAKDKIPAGSRALLALGSQYIDLFKSRPDVFYLVRMIDPPTDELPLPKHQLVISRPSNDWQEEAELLREQNITHIVCRNSGGAGAYAKVEAARKLQLPVIMVTR